MDARKNLRMGRLSAVLRVRAALLTRGRARMRVRGRPRPKGVRAAAPPRPRPWVAAGGWRPACGSSLAGCRGQATVEAAFLLPVLCVLVLLLVQPGILLYDRMVMEGAAADACRLLATTSNSREGAQEQCEAYVRRRLGAVPQQDCFHVHGPQCTWDIRLEGDEASQSVRVSIATEARPLPLLGTAASLLGIVNGRGNFVVEVSVAQQVQPAWVGNSAAGGDPAAWIGAWLDEA